MIKIDYQIFNQMYSQINNAHMTNLLKYLHQNYAMLRSRLYQKWYMSISWQYFMVVEWYGIFKIQYPLASMHITE